jgi:hypothetical protein
VLTSITARLPFSRRNQSRRQSVHLESHVDCLVSTTRLVLPVQRGAWLLRRWDSDRSRLERMVSVEGGGRRRRVRTALNHCQFERSCAKIVSSLQCLESNDPARPVPYQTVRWYVVSETVLHLGDTSDESNDARQHLYFHLTDEKRRVRYLDLEEQRVEVLFSQFLSPERQGGGCRTMDSRTHFEMVVHNLTPSEVAVEEVQH